MTNSLLTGLTRDYIKNPLKKNKNGRNHEMFERPERNDLE